MPVFLYSICTLARNGSVEFDIIFDCCDCCQNRQVDRTILSRRKLRYISYAIFIVCSLACIFGFLGIAYAPYSWGCGAWGTFFGWLAGLTLYLSARDDYPDFYMTIHFMLVRKNIFIRLSHDLAVHFSAYLRL